MGAVLQSFLGGFPVLMLHLATTTGMLAIAVAIYTALTPHHDQLLRRAGLTFVDGGVRETLAATNYGAVGRRLRERVSVAKVVCWEAEPSRRP